MYTLAILLSLLLAVNLAVFWFWLIKRLDDRGYGKSTRAERMSRMFPVTDETVVVERNPNGRDTVRTVSAQGGVSAVAT